MITILLSSILVCSKIVQFDKRALDNSINMRLAQEIFNYIFLIITSKTVIYVSKFFEYFIETIFRWINIWFDYNFIYFVLTGGVSFPPIITRQPSSEVLFHESKDPNVHDEFTISCGIGDQWTTLIDLSEP